MPPAVETLHHSQTACQVHKVHLQAFSPPEPGQFWAKLGLLETVSDYRKRYIAQDAARQAVLVKQALQAKEKVILGRLKSSARKGDSWRARKRQDCGCKQHSAFYPAFGGRLYIKPSTCSGVALCLAESAQQKSNPSFD